MYEYAVQFKRAVDGDTVDVVIDLGLKTYRAERLRLAGIDTPELNARDEAERKRAQEALNFVHSRLAHATKIIVETEKPDSSDKYGRWLGRIRYSIDGLTFKSLNDELVEAQLAQRYDGGAR